MMYQVDNESYQPCNCVGNQNGEPFCPCMMNSLKIHKLGNKWVEPQKEHGYVCLNKAFDEQHPELSGQTRGISCPCPNCSFR